MLSFCLLLLAINYVKFAELHYYGKIERGFSLV
jgi:hypothetical protein